MFVKLDNATFNVMVVYTRTLSNWRFTRINLSTRCSPVFIATVVSLFPCCKSKPMSGLNAHRFLIQKIEQTERFSNSLGSLSGH